MVWGRGYHFDSLSHCPSSVLLSSLHLFHATNLQCNTDLLSFSPLYPHSSFLFSFLPFLHLPPSSYCFFPPPFHLISLLLPSSHARYTCSWYPPGHGDVYVSLKRSGLLNKFREMGKKFIFISNIDNLGATVDLGITLDYVVSRPAGFCVYSWLDTRQ